MCSNTWLCFAFDSSQGLNGQKKYQIHLKSTSGPIDVLLVNKDAWSSPPVVLPVPPPEDLIQCQAAVPSKPQIPPLTHFQEASVPSSTQPSTPTPTSTQDHSPPVQKAAGTGEREAAAGRNGALERPLGGLQAAITLPLNFSLSEWTGPAPSTPPCRPCTLDPALDLSPQLDLLHIFLELEEG